MSHFKERTEKNCLNCNARVFGRYCHICGQENVATKESFWHLVTHFFNDITHFDGKFFRTVGILLRKPGLLSKEYMKGRRSDYLHPIRMYVFTSAIFFLVFFNRVHVGDKLVYSTSDIKIKAWDQMADSLFKKEMWYYYRDSGITRAAAAKRITEEEKKDTLDKIHIYATSYKTVNGYDSSQQALPRKQRDGWWKSNVIRKQIHLNEVFRTDPKGFAKRVLDAFVHKFPQLLFVSLPLFAFILKLVYLRRKHFYYADHGVFTLHIYIFTFIVFLFAFILSLVSDFPGWIWILWIIPLLFLYINIYVYRAMRNFYEQSGGKTMLKFTIVSFLSFIIMMLLGIIFFLFTSITI